MPDDEPRSRASHRVGRNMGALVFGVIVSAITATFSAQIIQQTFWPRVSESKLGCRAGLKELITTLGRARQSAAEQEGEKAAIDTFRRTLGPVWAHQETVRRSCSNDKKASLALSKLSLLRFAEEHALRFEARGIALQRREAQRLERELFAPETPSLLESEERPH